MRAFITTSIVVCASIGGCSAGAPRTSDHDDIQGVWLAETESVNGHTKDVTFRYEFKGDSVTFRDETGREIRYVFKLETTKTLGLMTIWPEENSAGSSPVRVGYELDGDSLKLVIAPPGLTPADLSDKHDQELIVCKRSTGSGRR